MKPPVWRASYLSRSCVNCASDKFAVPAVAARPWALAFLGGGGGGAFPQQSSESRKMGLSRRLPPSVGLVRDSWRFTPVISNPVVKREWDLLSLSLSLLFLRIRARKTDDWRSVNSQDLPCGGPRKVLPTPADKCVSSRSGKIHSAAGPK